jgi:hypothetical protein
MGMHDQGLPFPDGFATGEKYMRAETIESPKGTITRYSELDERLDSASALLDLFVNTQSRTIAIPKESLDPKFFSLPSGLAGEMLQKISNYSRRLIIVGDFRDIKSKSLRDFIYESNKTGQVVFVGTIEEGVAKLR